MIRLGCVAAAVALLAAGPAQAETRAEIRALAQAAQTSPSALARLRSITRADGRRVNLAAALGTSDPAELRVRLKALARPGEAPPALGARAAARSILAGRRFHGSTVPRPFHGVLVWLGEKLRPFRHAVHWLGRQVPGGDWSVWSVLAAAVVLLAAFAAGRTASRRGAALFGEEERRRLRAVVDPGLLERQADEAEAAGDPETALRLRYRAGLIRLGRAKVIPLRESLTSGEARRLIAVDEFNALARTHDEVAYGGRPARVEDARAARAGWPRVLAAKGVRT